jgi:hypothetical protein
MIKLEKIILLIQTLFHNPLEFLDRVEGIIISRFDRYFSKPGQYISQEAKDVWLRLAQMFSLGEEEDDLKIIEDIKEAIKFRMKTLEQVAPFTTRHHGDFSLAKTCYMACRILKPSVVIETGVAYGVTTAYVLKALELNGKGRLYSIDLPPLGKNANAYVGYLVPESLKERWVLHRGVSKRLLPKLLPHLGKVDVFIHDSLHTYWNIRRELEIVTPYLNRPAVVIVDDVQGNRAFSEWVEKVEPAYWTTFREEGKDALAGIAVLA